MNAAVVQLGTTNDCRAQVYVRHHSDNDIVKINSSAETGDLVLVDDGGSKTNAGIAADVDLVVGHPNSTVRTVII